jgi:hypothetical protein
VSGGTGVAVAVGEAEGLALAEAEGLATVFSSTPRACIPLSSKPRSSLAEAEALLIALVDAEALEAGPRLYRRGTQGWSSWQLRPYSFPFSVL